MTQGSVNKTGHSVLGPLLGRSGEARREPCRWPPFHLSGRIAGAGGGRPPPGEAHPGVGRASGAALLLAGLLPALVAAGCGGEGARDAAGDPAGGAAVPRGDGVPTLDQPRDVRASEARTAGDSAGPVPPGTPTVTGLWLPGNGAAVLAPCGEDRVVSVDASGGEVLNRAVRLARPGVDGPVLVTVRGGREAGGAAATGGRVRVEEVLEVHAAASCPGEEVDQPLVGPAWQLAGLPGPRVEVVASGAWLRLEEEPPVLEGFTGCVPLAGRYDWEVTRLRFGGLDAPPAAPPSCRAGPVHDGFLEALARAGSYRVRGDTLELLGEDGPLATFRAPRGSAAQPAAPPTHRGEGRGRAWASP